MDGRAHQRAAPTTRPSITRARGGSGANVAVAAAAGGPWTSASSVGSATTPVGDRLGPRAGGRRRRRAAPARRPHRVRGRARRRRRASARCSPTAPRPPSSAPIDAADLAGTALLHLPLYGFLDPAAAGAPPGGRRPSCGGGGGAVTLDLSATSAIDALGAGRVAGLVDDLRPVVVFANRDEAVRAELLVARPAPGRAASSSRTGPVRRRSSTPAVGARSSPRHRSTTPATRPAPATCSPVRSSPAGSPARPRRRRARPATAPPPVTLHRPGAPTTGRPIRGRTSVTHPDLSASTTRWPTRWRPAPRSSPWSRRSTPASACPAPAERRGARPVLGRDPRGRRGAGDDRRARRPVAGRRDGRRRRAGAGDGSQGRRARPGGRRRRRRRRCHHGVGDAGGRPRSPASPCSRPAASAASTATAR